MDVINLTGVWLNYPAVAGARRAAVAGIYVDLLRRYRQRQGITKVLTATQMRRSLLQEVEARIVQQDADDLFLVLAG